MTTLYVRLFVAFSVVVTLSVVGFYKGYRRVSRPNQIQVIGGTQLALAQEVAVTFRRGGIKEVGDFLGRLDATTQLPHYVIDEHGIDVISLSDRSAFLSMGPRAEPWGEHLA